ncbi:efflux RND transporter permease subunit [Photobacterium rosenbergii]|uniref:efflux RND transporter permease subunit n=1 Tax=Photobacterium rosenbergii TaxID=294936 RepID=UPI001C99A230|nr:efflux RND transporter permease subunit [Photobacterium rosenbergii]MBY5947860.1 efflux RND transporter permease subunit [Photobacterium rosenbergii]
MNLAEFALRQRTFVMFFVVVSIIGGFLSYPRLGKLEDPTFTVKTALVLVAYPGASAKEVEEQVTDVVETRLQEMATLNRVRSLSRPGMSMVFVDLQESTNTKALPQEWDLLRRKVNDLSLELPATAQIRLVRDEFSEVYGMLFSIYGDDAEPYELREYAKDLQRRIKQVQGVKKVVLHGVQNRAVYIDLPAERLAQYGLSAIQVWDQINSQSETFYAGSFAAGEERIRIDQSSQFQTLYDVENVLIKGGFSNVGTGMLRLGDIADITMEYQDPATTMNRFNGVDAVTVAVSIVEGSNVIAMGDSINEVVDQFAKELPLGVKIGTVAFQPEEVDFAIKNFLVNLGESILIVVVVLWLFMGFKSAFIVGTSLFLTILFTFIFMYAYDIGLQRVSLGAFIIALGMLVDNAIVITDMFKAKVTKGIGRNEAAISSVKETAIPLLGATVIAIMGSSPILFSKTDMAEFTLSLFQVMAASLLFSWFVAMLITPLLCWYLIYPDHNQGKKEAVAYKQVVTFAVKNPWKVLSGVVHVIVAAVLLIPNVQMNFMPLSDRSLVFLDYWLPNGSRIEQTAADMKIIESWLSEQEEVESTATFVGESAPRFSMTIEPEPQDTSYGQIVINTTDYEAVDRLIDKGDRWMKAEFPQAEPRFRNLKMATQDKYSIEARFSGPDPKVLHELANQAKAIFKQNPSIKYVRDDWRQRSKVIKPVINQERAREAGITHMDIAFALSRASVGTPLGQMHIGDEGIPIFLRGEERNLSYLESLPVRSLLGAHSVPLGQVVDGFEVSHEESMVWRRNRLKTITAQAGVVSGRTPSDVRKEIAEQIENIELPPGYFFKWGGEYYDEHKSVTDIFNQLPKALFVMVMIMVAMFNGFRQPLIIFATIPLAATGSAFSLIVFDEAYGFTALIGAISLSGMIIKNGIVLMDQIELERSQGKSLDQAIIDSTLNRTMAISMGALTTVLGMIPLLTDTLFSPMAATIIGGLVLATVLSLILMPAMYRLLFKDEPLDNAQLDDKLEVSDEHA